jgi:hypothetical protein
MEPNNKSVQGDGSTIKMLFKKTKDNVENIPDQLPGSSQSLTAC